MRNGTFDQVNAQYRTKPDNTQSVISGIGLYDQCTHGAIIHGNRKDPNNWSYAIDTCGMWRVQGSGLKVFKSNGTLLFTDTGTLVYSSDKPFSNGWSNRQACWNQALSRLNEKVRGSLDLGVDLAEAGQTRRMIRATEEVLKFARGWRGLAHFNRRDLSSLSDGWLQWQYGWRPLVQDVFDAAGEGLRIVVDALQKVSASCTMRSTGGVRSPNRIDGLMIPIEGASNEKSSCRFQVAFEPRDFDYARFSSLNPISLGWEIIPYSFVVDWFLDVGSYLRNVETGLLYGPLFRGGFASELYVNDIAATACGSGKYTDGTSTWSLDAATAWRKQRFFNRTILSSWPLPYLPSVKANLGWQRLTSAAALLEQLLRPK